MNGHRLTGQLIETVADRVDGADVTSLLDVLMSNPGVWGEELSAAVAVAEWVRSQNTPVSVEVDEFTRGRANLVATVGSGRPELAVYSHLDTSLTGRLEIDEVLTGRADPPVPITSSGSVAGPGVAVARGPAAAATVGFLAAAAELAGLGTPPRVSLLLAAGGTHRRDRPAFGEDHRPRRFAEGVRRALAGGWRPDAVIVAKAGPAAVLHEEPGSAYVDVELYGSLAAGFTRSDTDWGLIRHVPAVITAVESWRSSYVARDQTGQIGREVVIGSIEVGSSEKPDLLAACGRVSVYVVLGHGDDALEIVDQLRDAVSTALAADRSVRADVRLDRWEPAAGTSSDSRVVVAAVAATGLTTSLRGWRGSTDGVVFRAAGIDTVRWGPSISPDPHDPRLESVIPATLERAARIYAEMIVRYTVPAGST